MRATAIIPVKRFDGAKQRLADVLEPEGRAQLAAAMLADVLASLGSCPAIGRILIVSGEPAVARIAGAAGAELIADPDDRGHSQAASIGVRAERRRGTSVVALLPGDCPLIDPGELDAALQALEPDSVAVIPDRHGSGTNGLLLSPPEAIEPSFGPGSCGRHLRLARRQGISATVAALPSLGLDLDTGADLAALRVALSADRDRAAATTSVLADLPAAETGEVPR